MRPSPGGGILVTDNDTIKNDTGFPGSPPPSGSSSSTCSSPSPFSPLPSPTPHGSDEPALSSSSTFKKSMEEVWKDINLPSLVQDQAPSHTKHSTNPFPGMILQDFLARSFNSCRDPSPAATSTAGPTVSDLIFDSFGGAGTPLPPPPATILSLNSPGADPKVVRANQSQSQLQSHPSFGSLSFGSSISSAFDPFGSSPALPSSCKKRVQESGGEESGDRRHKRMIKNRESAARSRARKQAYTHELELEVAQLVEENAKLRRQQERLLAAAAQLPKKHTLGRTLTAPF